MLEQVTKTVEREIDGETYTIVLMTTSQALESFDKFKAVLRPVVEKLPKVDGAAKVTVLLALDFVLKGFLSIEGKDLAKLCKDSIAPFVFKNEVAMKVTFDSDFQGKLDVLMRLVVAFIEVQYGSFSKLLPDGMLDKLKAAATKASQLAAAPDEAPQAPAVPAP